MTFDGNAYQKEFAGQLAQSQQGLNVYYRQPTKRERLEIKRKELKEALNRVEMAIEALDAHPELETFINVLQEAGE